MNIENDRYIVVDILNAGIQHSKYSIPIHDGTIEDGAISFFILFLFGD